MARLPIKKGFREFILGETLSLIGVLICGNIVACASSRDRFRLEDLVPVSENFFGEIISLDENAFPNLDFIVRTRAMRGQDPLAKEISSQSYRYIRVHRDFYDGNSREFQNVTNLIRRFYKGDPGIKALEFWGRSSYETESRAGFTIDRTLELTGLSFYDQNPTPYPSAGGYNLDGVSGAVYGCPPPPRKKKQISDTET